MKNSRKIIIPIIGMLIILIIAMMNILSQPVQQIKTINGELKAYNHQAENMLDNVFKIDDQIILPFIFKNIDERVTVSDVTKDFEEKGLTIKNISTTSIGTGTQITIEESTDIYNVVVYGDVTGDGIIGLIDAQRIILNYLNSETNPIEGLKAIAANVSNITSAINLPDAQRLIMFYLGELQTNLVVNEPEEDPVIPSTPSGPSTPSTPSTPTVDSVREIGIAKLPTRTEYVVNETIDLTGGEVIVRYKSGKSTTIAMTSSNVTTTEVDTSTHGTKTIEVSYTTFKASFEITVHEKSDIVNKITLDTTEKTFIIGRTTTDVPVKFWHSYSDTFEKEIDVNYDEIEITDSNFELISLNNIDGESVNEDTDIKVIKTISLKPKAIGEQQIKVKVGDYIQKDPPITITVAEPELSVGNGNINLYVNEPTGAIADKIITEKKEVNGQEYTVVYTLVPITINEEYIEYSEIQSEKIKVKHAASTFMELTTTEYYKDEQEKATNGTDTVKYIAIAIAYGAEPLIDDGSVITIEYYPTTDTITPYTDTLMVKKVTQKVTQ